MRTRPWWGARLLAVAMAVALAGATAAVPRALRAQGPEDSALQALLKGMLQQGEGARARAIADSLVRTRREGSPEHAEALFLRAMVAPDGEAAERDYLRLAVLYPVSPRTEEGMLRLAQLALARGDRDGAKRQLERLARDFAQGPSTGLRALWLGRILLEDGDLKGGCAQFAAAAGAIPETDVESRNQLAFHGRPCATVDPRGGAAAAGTRGAAPSPGPASSRPAAPAAPASAQAPASAPTSAPAPPAARGRWSVQVAAFREKADADRLATRLRGSGYEDVRVAPGAPYRVRMGYFRDRADAVALVRELKGRKTEAIVVEAER